MANETVTPSTKVGFKSVGDVEILVCELRNLQDQVLDLKNFIKEIEIYEDMFSSAIQGRLTISDSRNLVASLPIVGNEVLSLHIKNSIMSGDYLESIKRSFYLYGIKNRTLNKDNEEQVDLLFCSIEAIKDNVTYISRKFEGRTDEIALQIFDEYLSTPRGYDSIKTTEETPLIVADTPHQSKVSFIANNWTPFQCLNYIAKRSIGSKSTAPTFLFYETSTQFYLTSFQALMDTQLSKNIILAKYQYVPKGDADKAKLSKYQSVENVTFPEHLDIFAGQDTGRFTSTTTTLDILTKKVNNWIWDHGLAFGEDIRTESYKGYDAQKSGLGDAGTVKREPNELVNHLPYPVHVLRSADTKKFFKTIHFNSTNNETTIPEITTDTLVDYTPELFTGPRVSSIQDFTSLVVNIEVPGRTDMEVGSLVEFLYPRAVSSDEKNDDQRYLWDPFISGVWMITAIRHKFTPTDHKMLLELAKDSFKTPFQLVTLEEISNEDSVTDQSSNVCSEDAGGGSGAGEGGQSANSDQDTPADQAAEPIKVNKSGWAHPTGGLGRITSNVGYRKRFKRYHSGIDIGGIGNGKPIYAAYAGVVIRAGPKGKSGYRVGIEHNVEGRKLYTLYAHGMAKSIRVKVGDKVTAGQHIMDSNNTGESTGPHLHFSIATGYPPNEKNVLRNIPDYIGSFK